MSKNRKRDTSGKIGIPEANAGIEEGISRSPTLAPSWMRRRAGARVSIADQLPTASREYSHIAGPASVDVRCDGRGS